MGVSQLLYSITFHLLLLYLNQTTGVTATQLQRHDSYCCNTSGVQSNAMHSIILFPVNKENM
ncbi:hypothetical protein PF004_g14203 [Phytophthora fragariae]|uniref:Uncharacterized protein n=1 Tax=Phytophthora fragariae TaxID=53985 RepID=A0A6G0NPX1_9STRA|nr:hypothetical protein PF004_g14203 [Phytophthora fragariae]KAE9336751.1 hypothetical protein PF008_g12872 [Phytophthora fragariae]